MHAQGKNSLTIGRALKRSPSTIYRELARNQDTHNYSPAKAHKLYTDRKRRARKKNWLSLLPSVNQF
ncbi:helix-turn-helix domain-containing protein [Lactobacillus sp. CC-MHH1034]|nr:helix-turn-helix domain-containing protein [Agrilactobacillus fermenti]